jgi:two-component system sensor histidine kinase YesM
MFYLQRLSGFLNRYSLRTKLIISYSLIVLLFLSCLGAFSSIEISSYINENTAKSYIDVLRQADANITYLTENYERLIYAIYINQNLSPLIIGKFDNQYAEYKADNDFNTMVSSMLYTYDYVPKLSIFVSRSNASSLYLQSFGNITDQKWLQTALLQPSTGILWYPEKTDDTAGYNGSKMLWVSKTYRIPYDEKTFGIIRLEIDPERIFQSLMGQSVFQNGDVYLVDGNGAIIYNKSKDILFSDIHTIVDMPDQPGNESGSFIQASGGTEYRYFYERIADLNWIMIGRVPIVDVLSLSHSTTYYIMFISSILIIAGFILIYIITRYFTLRLSKLTNEMVKVSKGTFDITVEESTHDEIGEMNKVFSLMIQKLKTTMDENTHMKTRELELQIQALQSQINPHFLYNTLSAINWMAINICADDISNALNALVTFYRIGLSKGEPVILIKSEIEHVKAYIDIQKIRLKDQIAFFFEIENAAMDLYMPKMILQPLVENAIYHGIEKFKKTGKVAIAAHLSGDFVVLSVADNGMGIPGKELDDILSGNKRSSGYGLVNIMEKVKLLSADKGSVEIHSDPGNGTTILIKIPASLPIIAEHKEINLGGS